MMIAHGSAPSNFRLSTLVPIPKNKRKSINDSNNYRAIALSSILGKVLDNCMLYKYQDILSTSDMQYGFKKHHSTTQCTFIVNEVIQYYINHNSSVCVTLLDASKAFDRVNYTKLFRLLLKRKLCPFIMRFLIALYTNQHIRVQWGSAMSLCCPVSNGVKQGGVMSPIVFTIYFDELLCKLRNAGIGCHVGNVFCGAIGYADDVTLLAPTICSLNLMLNTCQRFAESFDVLFNSSKSKLLYFGESDYKPSVSFMNEPIEVVKYDKHLGNIIGRNSMKQQIKDAMSIFISKVNMIFYSFPPRTCRCSLQYI